MNIYLIHGDNHIASYERLQDYIDKAKNYGWEIENIENNGVNIKDILRSSGLFSKKRFIVIKKYNLVSQDDIKYINKSNDDIEIVIYHEGNLPVAFIKKFKNIKKNENFRLSKFLWKFIDSFYPGNSKNCLYFFHESVKQDPAELIFSLLTGQLKDIFLILFSEKPLSYPAWRLQKLQRTAKLFGKSKIRETIKSLSEIDIKVKTSSADLKDELDLFIVRKLE